MSGYHVITEAQHDCDDPLAKRIGEILVEAYPGHPWHVAITGGLLVIKHMKISSKMGMVLHYKVVHDAKVLKRGIIIAGGELLERAGLTRGRFEEQTIGTVEGIKPKDRVLQ